MKCKIAIIDSGIDIELYKDYIIEYVNFTKEGEDKFIDDTNGHGTLCCSALLSINSNVEIIAIKVLDESNRCSSETVISALEYLLYSNVNIINLSLSTSSMDYINKYESIIKKLHSQGKIVIAANSNNNQVSLPAILENVIGVNGNLFLSKYDYWFDKSKKVQCISDKNPILLQGYKGKYELFGGNSKATAVFSGIYSKYWNDFSRISTNEVEKKIIENAQRNKWKKEDVIEKMPIIQFEKNDLLYTKLENTIMDINKISNHNKKLDELQYLGVNRYNAFDFITRIENELQVKINYSSVNLFWFNSIDSLYYYVSKEKEVFK